MGISNCQQCVILIVSGHALKTDDNFIIRPNDPDYRGIMQEAETYGVRRVAVLLGPLSALRYASKNGKTNDTDENDEAILAEEAEDDQVEGL